MARYEAIELPSDGLAGFFERLRAGEFVGGNVTIPHKELVFSLVDEVDPLAEQIGALNTLVVRNGRIVGSNTDYIGFLGNLDQNAPGWSDGLEEAIVLGRRRGGACRSGGAEITRPRLRAPAQPVRRQGRGAGTRSRRPHPRRRPRRVRGACRQGAAGGQHQLGRHARHAVRWA